MALHTVTRNNDPIFGSESIHQVAAATHQKVTTVNI